MFQVNWLIKRLGFSVKTSTSTRKRRASTMTEQHSSSWIPLNKPRKCASRNSLRMRKLTTDFIFMCVSRVYVWLKKKHRISFLCCCTFSRRFCLENPQLLRSIDVLFFEVFFWHFWWQIYAHERSRRWIIIFTLLFCWIYAFKQNNSLQCL